jgi:hypothetical protein
MDALFFFFSFWFEIAREPAMSDTEEVGKDISCYVLAGEYGLFFAWALVLLIWICCRSTAGRTHLRKRQRLLFVIVLLLCLSTHHFMRASDCSETRRALVTRSLLSILQIVEHFPLTTTCYFLSLSCLNGFASHVESSKRKGLSVTSLALRWLSHSISRLFILEYAWQVTTFT